MSEFADVVVAQARARASDRHGSPLQWSGAYPGLVPFDGAEPADSPVAFGAALAELASTIKRQSVGTDDDSKALAVIVQGAVAAIGGAQHAAIVVLTDRGELDLPAVQGDLPPLVVALQNEIGEGPTLDAVRQTEQILLRDTETDPRWPIFTDRARQWQVRSILCTPLAVQDEVFGSLSLVSTERDAFDRESQLLAAVFAAHATLALSAVRLARNLTAKADSRDIIGQAKGILMERYKLTGPQAFQTLVRLSQSHNIKLRTLCEELAVTGALPGV